LKTHNKWNCTIIALAMAMVLGVFDIHAVCLSCQEIVDDALDRACHEFAASPPNSEAAMVNAAVEIFDDILLNTELCDAGQPYSSSAAACQENLLSLLGVSQAALVPEPVPGPVPEPTPEPEPEPQAEVRVRKEIHAMTVEERTLFTQTYRQAWDAPNSELRQMADDFLTNFSRGLHNNGAFLPWHRGYLLQVENRLREISPDITIPYWDWSLSPRINQDPIWGAGPGQFSGTGGADRCVADDGPFGTGSGFELTNGNCLQRRLGGGSAGNEATVDNLFTRYPSATQYDNFRNRLEHGPGLNDSVHCLVGGTMCSARAANDPVFFLHHAMVDKIWARWQDLSEVHRSAYTGEISRDELMPASPYTPGDLLDMRHLPGGAAGGFVEIRYEE